MRDEELIFYDIEVFRYDSLVIFKDIDNNILGTFWNDRSRREAELTGGLVLDFDSGFEGVENIINGKVLVGYNNYNYDDHILTVMRNRTLATCKNIYNMNRRIVFGNEPMKAAEFKSLDTMQQIDVSMPSLKLIEGNLGKNIKETDVEFDIDRPLTDEERSLTEKYCATDIENTIIVYKMRKEGYFDVKESLIEMLEPEIRERALKWNTTTISAHILTHGNKTSPWTRHYVPDRFWSQEFRDQSGINPEVWEFWESVTKSLDTTSGKGKSVKQKTPFGVFVFGLGGLHGAPSKPLRRGKCKHKDVKSMYPSAIVTLHALDALDIYDQMRVERVKIKKSDPIRAGAMKIVLNSVYGNFKNQYSALYNPLASSTVCIYGQIALFTLCKRLYEQDHCEIINANTDGVVYVETAESVEGLDDRICEEWEKEFIGFELETDYYTKWIQKDVNNYIALEPNGKITVKGGEVNRYHEPKIFGANNARIVQIIMTEKLLNPQKSIVDIMLDQLDQTEDDDEEIRRAARCNWQFILRAGSTFAGVKNREGEFLQKVNRIFPAGKGHTIASTKLYKVKIEDNHESLINFPDVPEEMILWNDDVNEIENFTDQIDLNFYNELVNKKLEGWPKDVY